MKKLEKKNQQPNPLMFAIQSNLLIIGAMYLLLWTISPKGSSVDITRVLEHNVIAHILILLGSYISKK